MIENCDLTYIWWLQELRLLSADYESREGACEYSGNSACMHVVSSQLMQAQAPVAPLCPTLLHYQLWMKGPLRLLHHPVTWGVLRGCTTPRGISYTIASAGVSDECTYAPVHLVMHRHRDPERSRLRASFNAAVIQEEISCTAGWFKESTTHTFCASLSEEC